MRAKKLDEIIFESDKNIERHKSQTFKSGPFKGYKLGDIVYKLPNTMSKLYNDMYSSDISGDNFKDSLKVVLQDAKSKGYTEDDVEFRKHFPYINNNLMGKKGGYTHSEFQRLNPHAAFKQAVGDKYNSQSKPSEEQRQLHSMDTFKSDDYEDYSEPEIKYQDPTQWSKDHKKIYTDITVIIKQVNAKRLVTRYEGGEMNVEFELVGVTMDGYPVKVYTQATSIFPDIQYIAPDLSTTYEPIEEEEYQIYMVNVKRAVNTGVEKNDGKPIATMRVGSRENIDIIDPNINNEE